MPARSLIALTIFLSALFLPFAVHGADKKKKPKKELKAQPVSQTSDAMDSITGMIPEGKRNLKVRIPGFDEGRPSSLVVAAAMTRVNPQELFCETMRIDLFSKEPKDNLRVDVKTGTYHLDSKTLTSDERSRVSRSDFRLEGDTMEFDTLSSQGKMVGNVQMVIYDASSFTGAKPATASEPAPAPPASPSKEPPPSGK